MIFASLDITRAGLRSTYNCDNLRSLSHESRILADWQAIIDAWFYDALGIKCVFEISRHEPSGTYSAVRAVPVFPKLLPPAPLFIYGYLTALEFEQPFKGYIRRPMPYRWPRPFVFGRDKIEEVEHE